MCQPKCNMSFLESISFFPAISWSLVSHASLLFIWTIFSLTVCVWHMKLRYKFLEHSTQRINKLMSTCTLLLITYSITAIPNLPTHIQTHTLHLHCDGRCSNVCYTWNRSTTTFKHTVPRNGIFMSIDLVTHTVPNMQQTILYVFFFFCFCFLVSIIFHSFVSWITHFFPF